MGKLILCSGKYADNAYEFTLTKRKIYSIEELCYFLYNNIYLVSEDFFDYSLCNWLLEELDMPDIAGKLKSLIMNRNSIKDIVVSILCSADYYSEKEIKDLIDIMNQIERMPYIKKRKRKADNYLTYGQYAKAEIEYESILEASEAAVFTNEEYGDILHNLGVVKAIIVSTSEAARYFHMAYIRNQNAETLYQYLYALLLSKNEDEYKSACQEYQISSDMKDQIEEKILEKELEALDLPSYKRIEKLEEMKKDGRITIFYQDMKDTIHDFKEEYKKGFVS